MIVFFFLFFRGFAVSGNVVAIHVVLLMGHCLSFGHVASSVGMKGLFFYG